MIYNKKNTFTKQGEKMKSRDNGILSDKIFTPKHCGLFGNNKPIMLLINSPFDKRGGAVKFQNARKVQKDRGYSIINKANLEFNLNVEAFKESNEDFFKQSSLIRSGKPLTICFEAHGAPGWLFGQVVRATRFTEAKGTLAFAEYLLEIERKTGLVINNIILNSCFSAREIINPETGDYLNSPARLLSIVLPDKNVIGFVGLNSSVRVTEVFELTNQRGDRGDVYMEDMDQFRPANVSLEHGSMVFRAGKCIRENDTSLFCDNAYMPRFVLESCGIQANSDKFFRMHAARETVAKMRETGQFPYTECFADKQFKQFEKQLEMRVEKEVSKETAPKPNR